MLASIFTFRGRIARLRYFLSCLALAPATVIAFLMFVLLLGYHPGGGTANFKTFGLAAIVVGPLYLWIAFSLQTCRIRDIGWSPPLVIGGWIGLMIVDHLFAAAAPGISIGHLRQSTLVGLLVNLFFAGSLLFWPSRKDKAPDIDVFSDHPPTNAPIRPVAASYAAPTSVGFGRRGL